MFRMMNIRRDLIKKNIEMITEIIIIIKKEKDILLIIINMIDMKNMIQSMKDEVEVDIVRKDIIVIAKENIVEIVIVVVEELEVENIMNQDRNKTINIAFFTENQLPDLNVADYAIGCGHINHLDRYFTFPYTVNILSLKNRTSKDFKIVRDKVLSSKKRKKFCAAVISNPIGFRFNFMKKLNKYKIVDNGGHSHNNVGDPVHSKKEFLMEYKFSFGMENSEADGYASEKILDSLLDGTIPIANIDILFS